MKISELGNWPEKKEFTPDDDYIGAKYQDGYKSGYNVTIPEFVDFVLADRARIFAPLIKYTGRRGPFYRRDLHGLRILKDVDETLKLLGVDHD